MLVTSVGIGKYKIIYKKGDMMLECSLCFSDCGYSFVSIMNKVNKKMNKKMAIRSVNSWLNKDLIHFSLKRLPCAIKLEKLQLFVWNDTVRCQEPTNQCRFRELRKFVQQWVSVAF